MAISSRRLRVQRLPREIRAALPELNVASSGLITPQSCCRVEEPYLTQLKLLGAYTIPRVNVQCAGTFQSVPGPLVQANVVYSSVAIANSLGRPLAGNAATAQVKVVTPAIASAIGSIGSTAGSGRS